MKVQIFRISPARMKIKQIRYVIFQATIHFSFKFLCNFRAEILYALDKNSL